MNVKKDNIKIHKVDNNNYAVEFDLLKSVEDIRHILASAMRTKLLLTLHDSKKRLGELRKELGKPSATILHGLRELETLKLVKKEDKHYCLSSNGFLLALNMVKLIENLYSINTNFKFWRNHKIGDIPTDFLKNTHALKKSKCIFSDDTDLTKPLIKYLEMISKSTVLKILLPIFSKTHLDGILKNLNRKKSILEIVTTKSILNSIKSNEYGELLINCSKDNTIKIWLIEDEVEIFLSCCDNFLALSLFFEDDYYDDSSILVDESKEGILWGSELFEYYKEQGHLVDISKQF
ncbi:hypothetical protein MBCUT_04920 [Methanobrevibacter cuticularis]|uniref:Methanogenesis regulatory protein FilR1 middle domain-containing protein n=1 Tax=Methanobrevibacter cuticularis TaxID=47311 RepID=A0A166EP62_9EURY|nr:transcriptional regulator FilR1 domain-containing protein [Methanobrevibacter cuticularis]KZX16862.1 hypothetical protein MBCUT_04920 [Methanobrevibacter cuticularis]